MTATDVQPVYVRRLLMDAQPAPITMTGPIGWLRANLFATPLNTALTLLSILLIAWVVPPFAKFLVIDAPWVGADRDACLPSATRPEVGACWPFVRERFAYFIYGSYPIAHRWRVDVFFALLAVGVVWLLWLKAPRRDLGTIYSFIVLPIVSFILLRGWPLLGLPTVESDYWGGALVTIVVAAVGIAVSLPIGILLALGRRSRMPAVKLLSVIYIEFVREVPLITGLFKDTTLVSIVGMFDLLRTIEAARIDPKWATSVTSATGYVVAAIFYFTFCYMMARYARYTEARLAKSDRR